MIDAVTAPDAELLVSVASAWETAIKVRSGKLLNGFPLTDLPDVCAAASASLLDIRARHVLAELSPDPPTRDPFDQLLLAQAQLEGCQLVTLDRMLTPWLGGHDGPPVAGCRAASDGYPILGTNACTPRSSPAVPRAGKSATRSGTPPSTRRTAEATARYAGHTEPQEILGAARQLRGWTTVLLRSLPNIPDAD